MVDDTTRPWALCGSVWLLPVGTEWLPGLLDQHNGLMSEWPWSDLLPCESYNITLGPLRKLAYGPFGDSILKQADKTGSPGNGNTSGRLGMCDHRTGSNGPGTPNFVTLGDPVLWIRLLCTGSDVKQQCGDAVTRTCDTTSSSGLGAKGIRGHGPGIGERVKPVTAPPDPCRLDTFRRYWEGWEGFFFFENEARLPLANSGS